MVRIICLGGPLDGLECGLDTIERPAIVFPIPLDTVWDRESNANYDIRTTEYENVTYERSLTLETDEQGNYIYKFKEPA